MSPTTLKRLWLNSHIYPSKNLILLLEFWLLLLLTSSVVNAEGSRELIVSAGGQGYRPFLEFSSQATNSIPRKGIVKTFVNAGEWVYLGSSVYNTAPDPALDIVYRSPSGAIGTCDVKNTGEGWINTLAKEVAGPKTLGNPTGYTPCKFKATETGIYEVEFHTPKVFDTASNNYPKPTLITAQFPTDATQGVTAAAWDVTVMTTEDDWNTQKKGRAYVNYLPMTVVAKSKFLYSKIYVLTNQGFLYEINLNGVAPMVFTFFANNKGFTDQDDNGKSLFKSVLLGKNAKFHRPSNPDTATDVTHKMFLNPPDLTLPLVANIATNDDLPASGTNTWLLSNQPTMPVVNNFLFAGKEGTSNQAGTDPLGGNFKFDTTAASATYLLKIDVNQNGIYGDANDRILTGPAVNGTNTVAWDGLDGNGSPVPPSDSGYGANISLSIDDIHFPFLDIENNPKGIYIKRLDRAAPSTVIPGKVYYNNAGLTGGTPPNPLSALAGIDSLNPVQAFSSDFGNVKGIDTWTAVTTAEIALTAKIVIRQADLQVSKTHTPANPTSPPLPTPPTLPPPGQAITYTITVYNDGPSAATGIKVEDNIPSTITGASWSCAPSSSCSVASGTGDIGISPNLVTVNLTSKSSAIFTITGTVKTGLAIGTSVNNSFKIIRPADVANPQGATKDVKEETAKDTFTIALTPPDNYPPVVYNYTSVATPNDTTLHLPNNALSANDPNDTGVDENNNSITPSPIDSAKGLKDYTIKTIPLSSQGSLYFLDAGKQKPILSGDVFNTTTGSINNLNNIYFKPNSSFTGDATFTYFATDKPGAISNIATVTIPVTLGNRPPVPEYKLFPPITNPNNGTSFSLGNSALNATDPDTGDNVASYSITTLPPAEEGILYLGSGGSAITEGQSLSPTDINNLYFKPATDFVGITMFYYQAKDTKGAVSVEAKNLNSSTVEGDAVVGLQIALPPVLVNDAVSTVTNVPVTIPVLDNDIAVVATTTMTFPTPPANGKVVHNADGTVTYTPNSGYSGPDTFTYTACEIFNKTACNYTATVNVTISAPPIPIAVKDDQVTTTSDKPVVIPVLDNDTNVVPGPVTVNTIFSGSQPPSKGKVTPNSDGTITYTPSDPKFVGTDTFTYQVCNSANQCSSATVTVTITAPIPKAVNDTAETPMNTPVTVSPLTNDQNLLNAPPATVTTTTPAKGTVTVKTDGTLVYTPKSGYTGTDTFNYTVCNAPAKCATATVTVTITDTPLPPPALQNDSATTTSDKPVTIPILANDQNVDPKTLTITSQPAHDTVTKNPDGTVTYTPTNPTFTGTDTFTYQVCDSGNHCKTATVTVTVTAPPVTPPPPVTVILNNDQATANPGQPVTIPVLANDHNVDPNSLVIVSPPKNGQAKVNPDGTITYTPNPGFSGQDLFTYQVCDTQGACTTATITVNVAPQPPTVSNDTAKTSGDQPVTIAVLDNDPNGTGTITIATPPQNGTVSVNPDSTITYTPNAGFTGSDIFTYQVCDTLGQCDTATVTINVAAQPATTPPHTLFIAFSGNGTGNVVSLPAGINCNNTSPTCQATYNNGISVSLQATPNPESEFTGWGGDSDCNDGNVMMNKEVHCLAYFNLLTLPKFQLTVATQGEGTVVTQPVGIDCGNSCEAGYPSNALISATATPQPGFTFAGWSGDCSGTASTVLITMNQAKTCLATFETLPTLSPDQHRLIITKSGLGNGTITSNVPGSDCGPTCSSVYPYNTLLTVTALPDPGSQFIGWSIHCLGTDAAVNVLMDSDKSCIAVFDLEQPPLPLEEGEETLTIQNLTVHKITVVSDPVGIQITPQHSYGAKSTAHYPLGTVVKLQVTPEPGFKLIGFQGDADCYDGQVTVTKSLTCYPLLERDNYQINHGVIQFSSPNYIVDEFGTPTTLITVTRTGGCDGPVTVDYLSADGSANAPADYTSLNGTLSWAAGDCRDKIITLPVQDDKLFEEGESLQLKLLNPTGNAIIGPLANATVIIRDDDAQTPSTPNSNGGACYNLAPCQVCCSDCQTTDPEETGLQFKTLILTIKVGQTVGLGLADGQGDLLLKELPNRDLVSLESWQPQGKGAGELTFKGLKVGTTKLLIVDSAAPAKTATIQIKVIPADDNSDPVATTTSSHFGIEALLTTIKVGQTLSVTVAGGQGRLSLSQTPDTDLVALTSWIPLGNTGTGEITLTGLSVGNTEAVIIDQANPAHQTSINIKVIPGEGDLLATADNPLTVGEDGTLLWQGQPLVGTDGTFDQDNCGDNAWGFDAKGESIESPDCFIGQLSIGDKRTLNHRMFSHEEAKTLTIANTTIVAPKHIGLVADILLLGVHTTLTNETDYVYDGENWVKWDGRLDSFPVAKHYSKLPEFLEVPIYKGDLSFAPGEYTVFVGYRLSNETIIYNGKTPIHFYIGNAASVDLRSDSPKTITSQEVYSTAYFEPFVHNGQKGMDAKIGNDLLFETQEGINVSTFVRIDSLHVGQPANILIVATYQPADSGDLYSYVRQGYLWFPWDGKLSSLVPAAHYHQLPKTMEIPIYLGNLANLPGKFQVFVGYHLLDENVIIFNGLDPVQVTVADTSTPVETGATRSLFINDTAPRRNPFGSPTSTLAGQTTTLLVAPTDIGQIADIMMVVLLRQTDSDKLPRWEEWDNSSVILKVILPQVTLPAVLNSLPGFETNHFETGKYVIYWGYRLQNGTMVYNSWRF